MGVITTLERGCVCVCVCGCARWWTWTCNSQTFIMLANVIMPAAESSTALSMLYSKEYAVREVICRTLLSPKHDRRSYLLMLTTWMSEPYVDNDSHIKRYVQEMVNHVTA
jgi:hypothetical protein